MRKIDKIGDSILLYQGDCIEEMDKIPDGSIDMVLCDLPYGLTANGWDVRVPFSDLWDCYKRVVKHTGAIVLHSIQPFTSLLICSNIELFKYTWAWIKGKPTGFINSHHQPLRKSEDICVFSNGGGASPRASIKMPYFPQGLKWNGQTTRRGGPGENYYRVGTENFQKYKDYPTNILEFKSDSNKFHPTQKPVAMLEYLIKTYTAQGETVLDNTMGSGSTGVACVNTGRKFVGIELDEKYYHISKKRIEEALHMACE